MSHDIGLQVEGGGRIAGYQVCGVAPSFMNLYLSCSKLERLARVYLLQMDREGEWHFVGYRVLVCLVASSIDPFIQNRCANASHSIPPRPPCARTEG